VGGAAIERIEEITMLDLEQVDLRSLAEALEDHSPDTTWWFDPHRSGGAASC
jgi:hypothetical protein